MIGIILIGFVVGVLIGLTGMGGGLLMTPLLILLYGFSPKMAVGTDLVYAATTKAGRNLATFAAKNSGLGYCVEIDFGEYSRRLAWCIFHPFFAPVSRN